MTSDAQPRSKNGQPAQSTTGVASDELHPVAICAGRRMCVQAGQVPAHLQHEDRDSVSTRPIQNRRVMSTSSGFGRRVGRRPASGSSAMPQIGQVPGPPCRISRVHRAGVDGAAAAGGRRAAGWPGVLPGRPGTSPGTAPSRNGAAALGTPPCALPRLSYPHAADRVDRRPAWPMTMGPTVMLVSCGPHLTTSTGHGAHSTKRSVVLPISRL